MSDFGRILVTGANGFIGAHLLSALAESKIPANGLFRRDADLSDAMQVKAAIAKFKPDAIFHLASVGVRNPGADDENFVTNNVAMVENLLNALPHSAAFISVGSMAEYGRGGVLSESQACSPSTAYARSKLASGLRGLEISKSRTINFCHVRMFHVYGPGEPNHRMFPALLHGLKNNQPIPFSDGLQSRDFVHINDAVVGMFALLRTIQSGKLQTPEIVNLGTGVAVKIGDIARWTADALGKPRSLLQFGARQRSPADEDLLVADTKKFKNLTGLTLPQRLHSKANIAELMVEKTTHLLV